VTLVSAECRFLDGRLACLLHVGHVELLETHHQEPGATRCVFSPEALWPANGISATNDLGVSTCHLRHSGTERDYLRGATPDGSVAGVSESPRARSRL